MANDSSLGGAKHLAFDLDTQKGVAHVLASVRASTLQSEQKNELRDLIFLYSHGGKDPSVRIALEQKLATFAVAALPVAPVFSDVKTYSFGTSRPSPSFVPVSTDKRKPVAATVIPAPVRLQDESVVLPASVPVPQALVDVPKIADPLPIPTVPAPTAVVSEPSPVPVVVSQSEPTSSNYEPGKNLERIREIKTMVNERVGNPVNLVDINNQVGREYMGALLDAMKKVNSGSAAISAMRRLEEAFAVVEKTLSAQPPVSKKPTAVAEEIELSNIPNPNPAPIYESVSAQIESSPVAQPSSVVPSAVQIDSSVTKIPVRQPEPIEEDMSPVSTSAPTNLPVAAGYLSEEKSVAVPQPTPAVPQSTSLPDKSPVETSTLAEQLAEEKRPPQVILAGVPATIIDRTDSYSEIKPAWGTHTDTVNQVSVEPEFKKATSLADSALKPRMLEDLPTAASIETSTVAGDPLFTKEVDSGLEQLLGEWSLFKKSGLFGTGPSGREHPLYKKIAVLQIPLLLAGRFEGATQEIKQSITDYMNGWRYEQGIIYQQGENFDHYLRRVIRHILDLQNQ